MIGLIEAFIFFCIMCYLFNKARTDDMVDVLNQLPDVIGNGRQVVQRYTTIGLRAIATETQRLRNINKEQEKQAIERSLYQIKEIPVPNLSVSDKPLKGLVCRHCSPLNSESQLDPVAKRRNVTDILRITQHAGWRPDSSMFDWGGWFPFLAQCIRLFRFPFPQVSGHVLEDTRLRNEIEQSARQLAKEKKKELRKLADQNIISKSEFDNFDEDEYYEEMLKMQEKRAKSILMEMRSTISDVLLRVTSWLMYKLLPCFLSGVVAHPAHIEMLKKAVARAPDVPLVFLPLHRSHLDYIMVSFILLNNDIRAPIVAAGDNLKIPVFGSLLRGLGAFFIKRKIDPIAGKKDNVYRAALHTYMQHALKAGHNVEFFIEGGRTRTGKPCMPKSGILSVIIDAFVDKTIPDALIVPVSVNYERLVDGNFVYEQLGQRKKPETFCSAISAIWEILNAKYGLMRIDFNEPFSLQELVTSLEQKHGRPEKLTRQSSGPLGRRLQHQPSTSSLYGTDVVDEEHRQLVDSIARHVVYDCASATAIMTTNAIAYLLLNRYRDGVKLEYFAKTLDEFQKTLIGKRDIGFTGDSKDVILYAAKLLGPDLIKVDKRDGQPFIKPSNQPSHLIELSYYANTIVPHFALESIMITALQNLYKGSNVDDPSRFKTTKTEIFNLCKEHCDILRYEFIFTKPCRELNDILEETFDNLITRELIAKPEEQVIRHFNLDIDDSSDEEYHFNSEKPGIYLTHEGHEARLILMSAIAPLAHCYLATAKSLGSLVNTAMLEADFVKVCVKEITSKVESGECKYGESISTDSIRNCLKMLEKLKIIDIKNNGGVRQVSLTDDNDDEQSVEAVVERILRTVPIIS